MYDTIKVLSVTRSKYMPLSFMRNNDGSFKSEFRDLYLNMVRNQVSMDLQVSVNRESSDLAQRQVKAFGTSLQEFLDKNCKGLWSEQDEDPVEAKTESSHSFRMSVFNIKINRLFEFEDDADRFVKNYALLQKLTLG